MKNKTKVFCSICNAPMNTNTGICMNCRKEQMSQFNKEFKHLVKENQQSNLFHQVDELITQYKLSNTTTQLDEFLTSSDFFRNSTDTLAYIKNQSDAFYELCCQRFQALIEGTPNPENLIRKLIVHREMMECICNNHSQTREILQSMLTDLNADLERNMRKRAFADTIVKRQRNLILESKIFFAVFGLLFVFSTGYFVFLEDMNALVVSNISLFAIMGIMKLTRYRVISPLFELKSTEKYKYESIMVSDSLLNNLRTDIDFLKAILGQ